MVVRTLTLLYFFLHFALKTIIAFLSSHVLSVHFSKVMLQQDYQDGLEHRTNRTFGLFGLTVVSLASCVGSGTFVVSGLIAGEIAGPAGIFSLLLAAIGSSIVAISYAELSCSIPASGGPYSFVYNLMGEIFAVLLCWLISLEFGIAGAGVSRAWSDKLIDFAMESPSIPYLSNILAAAMVGICTLICARGLEFSEEVLSVFVVLKVLLIVFITSVTFWFWNPENLSQFAPYGFSGVVKGSTVAFFGYIGFDESCIFAAEAKNPSRDLALSMIISIAIASTLYVTAYLGLTGSQPYDAITSTSTFWDAFEALGVRWAGVVAIVSQLVIFPSAALAAAMAQPKILYILARDKLIPSSLGGINKIAGFESGDVLSA